MFPLQAATNKAVVAKMTGASNAHVRLRGEGDLKRRGNCDGPFVHSLASIKLYKGRIVRTWDRASSTKVRRQQWQGFRVKPFLKDELLARDSRGGAQAARDCASTHSRRRPSNPARRPAAISPTARTGGRLRVSEAIEATLRPGIPHGTM